MAVSRVRRLLHPLLIYTLLALLLTWPLLQQMTTHVPGDGIDDPSLAWNLWWIKTRLVDQLQLDIFHVDWMFHPIGINLAFYTLTPLNGLLSIPLQSALSLILANNLILLSSFVLGGFGTYLFAKQELVHSQFTIHNSLQGRGRVLPTRVPAAAQFTIHNLQFSALFAGIIYAFASSKLFYAGLGQFNIASSQWIPFCALYTLRLARSNTRRANIRNAFFAALFLTLQAWSELTYASFLLIFIGLVFCWSLWSGRPIIDDRRNVSTRNRLSAGSVEPQHATRILSFILLGLLFLIGIAPFLWAMLPDMRIEGDFFGSGGGFADNYSADLLGYLLPTQRHPLLGWVVDQFPFPHDKGQQIFIGYSTLLLAVLGMVSWLRRKSGRSWLLFWIGSTFFFWWMTLGAQLRWNGNPLPIPGPFALISQLPFFSGNRYPSRYSVMLMMGIAILAGAGLQYLLSRVSPSRFSPSRVSLALLFIALFLFEQLAVPMPLSDFRVPEIYARLAAEPGDFTLLELPTGWRNGARVMGKSDLLIMMQQWYQTTHGKRRLGGNTSRNPAYKFQYFVNAPLIGDLIALMNATPDNDAQQEIERVVTETFDTIAARDRPLAAAVLDFLDVDYVTVHVEKASPALLRFVDEVLPLTLVERWQGPDWSGTPSTILLYRVAPVQQPSSWTIDLADDLTGSTSSLYLAEGWSALPWQGVRYATRPCATLLLDLPENAGTLTLALADPAPTLTVQVNGQVVRTMTTPDSTVAVTLRSGMASEPIDRVTLCTAKSTPVDALTAAPTAQGWPIGESGMAVQANLVVQSAGNDVGNFAHIYQNGKEVITAQTGYNLAAFDTTGTLLATANFNTFSNAAAAEALADWLYQWPAGTVIAGAVMDEASHSLTQRTVDALMSIGLDTDLRQRFRWSHAFVGAVGAASGTAIEEASLLRPAVVAVGVAVDAPAVTFGIAHVAYETEE